MRSCVLLLWPLLLQAGADADAGPAGAQASRATRGTNAKKGRTKARAVGTTPVGSKPVKNDEAKKSPGIEALNANATAAPIGEKTGQEATGATPPARPAPPLFAFPPAPGRRSRRGAAAEDVLEDVLPTQQRVVKYLTDDRIFTVQVACSFYSLAAMSMYLRQPSVPGSYTVALAAIMLKAAAAVLGRTRRVLMPHLLYEPDRYSKFRSLVAQLAAEPSVQSIVYCLIVFMLPLGRALAPLALREAVYLSCVAAEVLGIAAPALLKTLATLLEWPLAVLLAAGDTKKLRSLPAGEKRALLGRRVAQLSCKLEWTLIGALYMRVFAPGVVQRMQDPMALCLYLLESVALGGVYLRLLAVKNAQLGDDTRVFKGLRVGGVSLGWLDVVLDSLIFAAMLGLPWYCGLLMPVAVMIDPRNQMWKDLKEGESATAVLREKLFDAIVGRDRSKDAENDLAGSAEEDDAAAAADAAKEAAKGESEAAPLAEKSSVERGLKVAAVALGLSND